MIVEIRTVKVDIAFDDGTKWYAIQVGSPAGTGPWPNRVPIAMIWSRRLPVVDRPAR